MNARFWVWANGGPVKLTLRPGQVLRHAEGGPNEEGYSIQRTTWELAPDEPVVYRDWSSEARDCDGVCNIHGSDSCPIGNLNDNEAAYEWTGKLAFPNWGEREATEVYDQYAQAAGY